MIWWFVVLDAVHTVVVTVDTMVGTIGSEADTVDMVVNTVYTELDTVDEVLDTGLKRGCLTIFSTFQVCSLTFSSLPLPNLSKQSNLKKNGKYTCKFKLLDVNVRVFLLE